MSLMLRDGLVATEDWDAAAHAYARDDRYYRVVHGWFNELLLTHGPQATARRQRGLSLIAQDPMRIPDHVFSGPDLTADETVRRRFFGEAQIDEPGLLTWRIARSGVQEAG